MHEIGKNISILYRQFHLFLNHELEGTNITATELMYLASLYQKDGITQDDLVKEYCIDKAATARTIQGMEKKGLILRKPGVSDKRSKNIYLTDEAYIYRNMISQIQKKWLETINIELSQKETDEFAKTLAAVTQKAKRMNQIKEENSL